MQYHFHLRDSLKNVYVYIFCFFCSFSYRGKVITKGVSNIIGTGYSITIIKRERERESTVGILDATVIREMRDLIPFHVSRYLFPFCQGHLFDWKSSFVYKAGRQQEIKFRLTGLLRLFHRNFNDKIIKKKGKGNYLVIIDAIR